jgi:hypothetical protein
VVHRTGKTAPQPGRSTQPVVATKPAPPARGTAPQPPATRP